jgi:hypothetical protein
MTTPTSDEFRAGHAVLIEVLNVLGSHVDGMVVIGGWVPELMFPNHGHIGSLDVDLAVDGRMIRPGAYESIRKRLVAAGYVQVATHVGVFTKELPRFGAVTVKLDLVAGDAGATEDGGTHALVQDLSLGRLRGVGLAFEHAMRMTLTGVMPDGSEHSVQARVVDVPAFLCLKAFALSERVKPKDAYDVFFCLRHYRNGPGALAAAARPLLNSPEGRSAIEILRGKFGTLQSVGPRWAAEVAAGAGEDRGTVRRDAYERCRLFLEQLDEETT